jgi:sugar transferase EpsL
VVALIAVIVLSWLMVLIVLAYVISFQFPIFFSQQRIGRNDVPFTLLKFRTLSPATGLSLQERRFPLGDFLRFTNLDELPQLWNILKGEMSLVGPRPLLPEYLPLFNEEQRLRHRVKPGVTGLAQVDGSRHTLPWEKKLERDIVYIRNLSFSLDLRIIAKTILLLFAFKRDVSLNEKPFTGNRKNE